VESSTIRDRATDENPLVQVRHRLDVMNKEVGEMEVRIGLHSAMLHGHAVKRAYAHANRTVQQQHASHHPSSSMSSSTKS
jgi:hypothetical protein